MVTQNEGTEKEADIKRGSKSIPKLPSQAPKAPSQAREAQSQAPEAPSQARLEALGA